MSTRFPRPSLIVIVAVALAEALGGCRATLAEAPSVAVRAPDLTHLPMGLVVCWIETAQSFGFTSSSLLIRHPSGDLLVDAGASSHFDENIADYPFFTWLRLKIVQGPLRPDPTLPTALRAAGEDPAKIQRIVITHAHGDHLGGLEDMPTTPGLVAPEELAFLRSWHETTFHTIPKLARAVLRRLSPIAFVPLRYEVFPESADLFGDGSVVLVKLPGHTPGSLGAIVNLGPALRLFHVGDAAHDLQGITRGQEKAWLTRATDIDKPAADATVARLHRLWLDDHSLTFLPAHDRAQWLAVFGGEPPRCLSAPPPSRL